MNDPVTETLSILDEIDKPKKPPGYGPSTFAAEPAKPEDMLADLDAIDAAERQKNPPGFFKSVAGDVAGGLVDLGEMYGRGARALPGGESAGIDEGGIASKAIKWANDFKKENPSLDSDPSRTGLSRWFHEGVRSATTALAAGAPGAAAGALAGSAIAPGIGTLVGGVLGFATGGATTFGLAEYDSFLEEADKKNVSREQSEPAALRSGIYEAGFEFAGNILEGATLGVGRLVTTPAKQALKQGVGSLFKKSIKDTLLRQAGVAGIETGSEVLTGGLQTEERFKLGITDQRFMDGAIDAFGPALVASMIFGGVGEVALRKVSRDVKDTLRDPSANPEGRLFAAKSVYDAIKPSSQTVADKWYETAFKAIKQGEAIDLDAPMETDPILDKKIADDDALGRRAAEEAARQPPAPDPDVDGILQGSDDILKTAEFSDFDPVEILTGRQVAPENIPPATRGATMGPGYLGAGQLTQSPAEAMLSELDAIDQAQAVKGEEPQPAVQTPPGQPPITGPTTGAGPIEPTGPIAPTPAPPAAPAAPVGRPAGIDIMQEEYIKGRIAKLGSLEAVNKAYSGTTNVEQYARKLAEETFRGQPAAVAAPGSPTGEVGITIEAPGEAAAPTAKPVTGPSVAPEKPGKFQGTVGFAFVDDQKRAITATREITRGKKKGQFFVTLTNGKIRRVPADAISAFPQAAAAPAVTEAAAPVAPVATPTAAPAPGITIETPPAPAAGTKRGEIGMKLSAGEIVTTTSGRQTTPFPKYQTAKGDTTARHIRVVDRWLLKNAADEARARGDDFNAPNFERAANYGTISQADKDSAEQYLFGEQPKVIPPITKTLTPAPAPQEQAAPKSWFNLGKTVAQEYTNEDKTGKTTVLKPNGKILRAVASRLGIKPSEAYRSLEVYNSEDPRQTEKRYKNKPVPDIASQAQAPAPKSYSEEMKARADEQYSGWKGREAAPETATLAEREKTARPAWNDATPEQREAIAKQAGWATPKGNLTPKGKAISKSNWEKLSPAAQRIVSDLMPGETTGEQKAAEKEPWQMTQVQAMNRKAEKAFPTKGSVKVIDGKPVYTLSTTVKWGDSEKTIEISGKHQQRIEKLHKEVVKQALADGLPVPAEVLADYPDLTAAQAETRASAPKPKPARPAKESKITTLRGRILKMGKINPGNMKGEFKDVGRAVSMLLKKDGQHLDLAEQTLRDEGWLGQNENLVDVLRDPENLRRNKVAGEGVVKREQDKTAQEKQVEKEMAFEPEAPPEGTYVMIDAEDLPEGKKFTLIDDSAFGHDTYEVTEKDAFSITIKDGRTIELTPNQQVQVRREDLPEKAQEKADEPTSKKAERFTKDYIEGVKPTADRIAPSRRPGFERILGVELTDDQVSDLMVEMLQIMRENGDMALIADASPAQPEWLIEQAWGNIKTEAEPAKPKEPIKLVSEYDRELERLGLKYPIEVIKKFGKDSEEYKHLKELEKQEGEDLLGEYRKTDPKGAVVLENKEKTLGYIITKSAKEAGRWQATSWDERGFSGDMSFKTEADAIKEVVGMGYNQIAKDRFAEISKTDKFIEGVAAAEKVQKDHRERMMQLDKEAAPKVSETGITTDWQGKPWDGIPAVSDLGENERVDNKVLPGDLGTGPIGDIKPYQSRGAAIGRFWKDPGLKQTHDLVHVGREAVVLRRKPSGTLVLEGEKAMPKTQAELRTKGKQQRGAQQGGLGFAAPETPEVLTLVGEKVGAKEALSAKKIMGEAAKAGEKSITIPSESEFVASDEIQKWERDHYVKDGGTVESSRKKPMQPYPWKEGAWKIDKHFGPYGRMVEQVRRVKLSDLALSEEDYTKVNFEGRGFDAEQYAQWMKEGKTPPPVLVVETDTGGLLTSDGHRRVAAAKLAGVDSILAWVSPRMDTGKKDSSGKPIYVAATYEGLKHGPEKAQELYDQDQKRRMESAKEAEGANIVMDRLAAEKASTTPNIREGSSETSKKSSEGVSLSAEEISDLVRSKSFLSKLDNLLEVPSGSKTLGKTANRIDRLSPSGKSSLDRVRRDAQSLRDILNSKPFLDKGFSGLDAKTQGLVASHVLGLGKNDEVVGSVVKFIPVDVMDNLTRQKITTNNLFNDSAVLSKALSGDLGNEVSAPIDMADSLIRAITLAGAEVSSGSIVSDLKGPSQDRLSTSGASDADLHGNKDTRQNRISQDQKNLEDFGTKLGGARKDLQSSISREISDDEIATKSFSEVWPKSEVDSIEDEKIAAVAHALRSEVPSKPRKSYKVTRWVEQIKTVRGLMKYAQENGVEEVLKKMDAGGDALRNFASKIRLLQQVDRTQWDRVGGVKYYPKAQRYEGDKLVYSPYAIAEIDNRTVEAKSFEDLITAAQGKLAIEHAGSSIQFEIRSKRDGSQAFINKKGDPLYRPLKTFKDVAEAREFMKTGKADLVKAWEDLKERENVKETDVRREENRPRTGKDHRQGKDATPEMFTSSLGFRGVEFGNWVSQGKNAKERQGMLNQAYDALMDLADILGVPSKALSLNGTLGLGLGSRGHGWASAHYEPDTLVINLTKTRGAGSIGHEIFHAIDNYFQLHRGKSNLRSHEANYITGQPETYYENTKTGHRLSGTRFNEIKNRGGLHVPTDWKRIEGVRPEVEEAFAELVKALDESPMKKRSSLIDKGKSGGYWSRVIERAARAFENYIIFKMQQQGYQNDYLANVTPANEFSRDAGRYPYLLDEEVKPIAEAFDNLFATIKTEETDKGVKMLKVGEKQTDTPEFKKWFGKSKVVDDNGKPLVVYHGTNRTFGSFDTSRVGDNTWASDTRQGSAFFFSDSKDLPNRFAERDGGNVVPAYLSIKNPHTVDLPKYTPNLIAEEIKIAKQNGNDGVIITPTPGYAKGEINTGTFYISFSPAQIKSAIGNQGTFDPNNPDIRLSMGATPSPTKQSVERIQQLVPVVEKAMRTAGLPQEVIDRVRIDLKPIIDLTDKEADESLKQWAKEGKSMDVILGATTFKKWSALMELSLNQDLNSLEKTTYHEAYHIAAEWMLTPEDNARVGRFYRTDEGAAEAFADLVSRRSGGQPAPVGAVRRAFLKLRNMLEAIGNFLRGRGITKPEEIFGKLMRGEVAPHFGRGQRDTTTALAKGDLTNPIQAFHWSTAKIEGDFDFNKLGEKTAGNNTQAVESAKLGAWFSESDKPIAEGLTVSNPANLTLKNPLVLKNNTVPAVDILGDKIQDAKQWLMDEVERAGGGEKLRAELQAKGYDGIILEDSEFDNAKSYIVFDKGQVKFDKSLTEGMTQFRSGDGTPSAPYDFSSDKRFHNLFYGTPTAKEVKEFGSWLRERPNEFVRLYHGTAAIHPIGEQGIKRTSFNRRNSYQSASGYSYLSVYPGTAKDFGSFASLNRAATEEGKRIAVYPITVTARRLLADTDQLNNQRMAGREVGNSLAESLVYGHGARVKGDIETTALGQATQFRLGRKAEPQESVLSEIYPAHVVERVQKAMKGVDRGAVLDKIKSGLTEAVKFMTPGREYLNLDPTFFGKAYNILRGFKSTKNYADKTAEGKLREILDPKNMSKRDYEIFTAKIALNDLARELEEGGKYENWEAMVEKYGSLQFGFKSADEVSESLAKVDGLIEGNKTVKDALARREKITGDLLEQVVDADLLPAEVLKDKRYFHHQVLEYLNERYSTGTGAGAFHVGKKGYQRARIENAKDYSLAYIQSEYEVMAHQLNQLGKKKYMDRMEEAYNIAKELRAQAKHANYVEVVGGQENYDRLVSLRSEANSIKQNAPLDSEDRKALKSISEEIREIDPTMPFRSKMAMGYAQLEKALGITADDEFGNMEGDELNMAEVARLAKSENEAESIPARTILKALGERNAFIKETLGGRFKTELDLMKDRKPIEGSKGWASWVPNPRSAWFLTGSIADATAQQIMAGSRELQESDIKPVFARGRDESWIIPAELAQTLEGKEFDIRQHDNIISKFSEQTLNAWKRWVLINPMRLVKYNLNNMSGDFDIVFAYDPAILKEMKQAAVDLWKWHYNKEMTPALKAEFDKALEHDGISSGMTSQDIPDINNQEGMRQLMEAMGSGTPTALRHIEKFWQGSKNFTAYRENILRLASYRHFKNQIKAGKKVYGVSNPSKVDAATDIDEKAWLLGRELVGDYGALSPGGQWLRRKLIPFYSWWEINAPRYYRLYKNLAVEGQPEGRRLRMGAVAAKQGALLTAKVFALYAAAQLFNHLFWPDEEDELGEVGRRQAHLILGRREDGSIITVRVQGALSDALSWFGLEDFPEDIRELASGKKSIGKFAAEAALAPVNKFVQGTRPEIKGAGELLTGRTLYPDFTKPRPIRDRAEYVAQMLSAESLYRRAVGRPLRGDSTEGRVLSDLLSVFTYSADPQEVAYYKSRDLVNDYLKEHNLERPMADPTNRVNALYYYKQAVKFGDAAAAEKYLNQYKELGGNMKGIQMSVKRAHPLGSLPNKDRAKFFNSLDPEERQTVKRGTDWYRTTYKGGA